MVAATGWASTVAGTATGAVIGGPAGALIGAAAGLFVGVGSGIAFTLARSEGGSGTTPSRHNVSVTDIKEN